MDPTMRSRLFKMPPVEDSQNTRRMRRLEEQKRSRALKVESARNVDIFAGLSLNEIEMEEEKAVPKAKRPSRWANVAMYAEPLEMNGMGPALPDDFGTAWIAVAPVPKGKRCLVIAYKSNGQGSVVSLRSRLKGNQLMRFPSRLPTDTILDCILDEHWEHNGILHVLDVLRWRGQDYTQCEASFRFWWRDTKIAELEPPQPPSSSSERPPRFSYPHVLRAIPWFPNLQDPLLLLNTIIPLARTGVTVTVPLAPSPMSDEPNELVVPCASDGILLYVGESSYEKGPSLLAAWVPVEPFGDGQDSALEVFARHVQATTSI